MRLRPGGCLGLYGLVCALAGDPLSAQDADYIQQAAQSSIFLYSGDSQPCAPLPPGQTLLPLGSGFVVGLTRKGTGDDGKWRGWKFLITAQHVLGDRASVVLRLNRQDAKEFTCFSVALRRAGTDQNVFLSRRPEVDLLAISVPDVAGADPAVFGYSLMLDEEGMRNLEVRVGTDVFTVGYVYGYSGNKQNYPVTKFGKVALFTDESWYYNNERKQFEQAYLIELQNAPGLSGAPVMLQSPQLRVDTAGRFQFRRLSPYVVGVIKGVLISPLGTQGVTAIEPAFHLKELLKWIAEGLRSAGLEVELEPGPPEKKE